MEASMSSLDRTNTTISDLYKGLDVITQLLKDINIAIKDDLATNQKINEATKTFAKISFNITEVLFLVKGFDFFAFLSAVKSLRDHAFKKEEASTAWMKSSTNMAWNLSSRMSGVELSQTALKQEISSLRKDTSEIKSMMTEMLQTRKSMKLLRLSQRSLPISLRLTLSSKSKKSHQLQHASLKEDTLSIESMMTEMYEAFKGRSSSALSGSVTLILALTHIPANVDGENATNTATKEPPSHTEGENEDL
ncbi:hypothetical protein Tco_1260158 [Tanacetum coccineum]